MGFLSSCCQRLLWLKLDVRSGLTAIHTTFRSSLEWVFFSFPRYDDTFHSSGYAGRLKKRLQPKQGDFSVFDRYYTPPITSTQLLLRSCKGSNHLEESDRRPLDFCPICLHKLQVTIGFNIADRYKTLLHWMEGIRVKHPDQRTPLPVNMCSTFQNPLKPFRHPDCGSAGVWTYWGEKINYSTCP
ncbi:hypothetical protein PFLUV_G00245470 [Perca fluviatilis]|uniref:Uncharacterized protein n=1 Tax=Perca fluviatilis TaxID=8168 RepID=A0A6A5EDQ6_PERFL|nr:hypothetical protein PFLUV_G00245470 [Perca fluviatilis]